jgi:RNA polymerase sigma-70 factor (ECF subfamily)
MIPIVLTINSDNDRFFVEKLYRQYRKNIYASAFKVLNHRQDAEDCVHEVIQTVIRHIDAFQAASPEGLAKLLAVCTRNTALNIYRKNKRKKANETGLPFDPEHEEVLLRSNRFLYQRQSPAAIAVGNESKHRLLQIISELDDIYRDVLVLYYQYRMNNREIADILKISPNTVNVRLHRAKKMLLEEKGAELDEIRKNGSV